jgi:DNA-binding NarL/FixJ family response regulator
MLQVKPDPVSGRSLVGRDHELEIFERALARLAGGSSQVIEVTGDPGIGKTRLFAELGRLAAGRDIPVLDGRAQHGGQRIPFYALVDALDDRVAGLVHDVDLDVLGSVFPSLSGPGREAPRTGLEQYRVFRAVRTVLESLVSPGLVLLLDDLQWADDDTVGVLAQLLHHPPRRPVLLALAYRWRQAPARLRAAVAAARGDYPPACLRLSPLSAAEAETMLAGRGSRAWRREVYLASGGNPFYLEALARSGPEQWARGAGGGPAGPGPADEMLPPAVTAALLAEVEALSRDGQLAARSAAVIGDPFCVMSVSEVSGLDEEHAAASVAELAAADLIRPVDATRLFSFRHALVRSVTYESANPAWRIGAHGRTAAALRHCGAPLTAQAHHVERAAEFGDLAAVGVLAEAAGTVQAQAPGTAAQWLRAALGLVPDSAGPGQRAALMFRLGYALGAAGRPDESRDTLRGALRLPVVPQESGDGRAAAVAFCAHMERQLGRYGEGQALLLAELATVPDRATASAAALKFQLGCNELAYGDHAGARRWAREALRQAGPAGPAGLRAAVLGLLATTDATCGDIPSAVAHLTSAAALLDGMLDSELEQRLDAASWVGWSELLLERPVPALRHLDRGLALVRDNSQVLVVAPLLIGRVLALRTTGRLAQASAAAEEATEAARLSGSGEQQAAAQALRASLAAWTGDLETAHAAAAAAADRLPRLPSGWLGALAARTLADARLALGDPEGCLALAASGAGAGWSGMADWAQGGWYELLTRAELAADRPLAAARWAAAAAEPARWADLPGRRGLALLARAQGIISADPRAAYDLAVAAADALSAGGMALDAARATLAAAAALAARGDPDRACAEARAAQAAFRSCGAGPAARSAAGLRRRMAASRPGNGRGRGDLAGYGTVAALTQREQQVASLVSHGLTNRGIAERLHVTDKTVEMHLSNIFAKLGVSTRTEAAAILIRAGKA